MNDTVSETLRAKLHAILVPDKKVTLRTCAKESGVSAATISRFVRGKPITSTSLDALTEWANKR